MMTVDVRSRVEPELKRDAAAVINAVGLDVSTAIRLFLRSVVETGGLPIAIPRPFFRKPYICGPPRQRS